MHTSLNPVFISKSYIRYCLRLTIEQFEFAHNLRGDSIMPEYTPEGISVNVNGTLFEINEGCIDCRVQFLALFHDLP